MKTKVLALLALAAACGQEPVLQPASARTPSEDALRAESRTRPTMPPVTTLDDWGTDRRFFSADAHNVFWVITLAPPTTADAARSYLAFGVDVDARQVVFQIALTGIGEVSTFSQRANQQVLASAASNLDPHNPFHFGGTGQINQPPPPPPGPGGDGWLAAHIIQLGVRTLRADAEFAALR